MLQMVLITLVGFIASLVDGGLGMGFGPISASLLLLIGIGTAATSAIVNLAQTVTALVSTISNIKIGNINIKITKHLIISGIPGGILGTIIASYYTDVAPLKIFISVVLIVMGILIIIKMKRGDISQPSPKYLLPRIRQLWPIGFFGGVFSAVAGSWGPIVTAPLLIYKSQPRKTIGSVNAAEFAVRFINVILFMIFLKTINLQIALPLMVGGAIAAPLAVFTIQKIPHHIVGIGAGSVIIILSLLTIVKTIQSLII